MSKEERINRDEVLLGRVLEGAAKNAKTVKDWRRVEALASPESPTAEQAEKAIEKILEKDLSKAKSYKRKKRVYDEARIGSAIKDAAYKAMEEHLAKSYKEKKWAYIKAPDDMRKIFRSEIMKYYARQLADANTQKDRWKLCKEAYSVGVPCEEALQAYFDNANTPEEVRRVVEFPGCPDSIEKEAQKRYLEWADGPKQRLRLLETKEVHRTKTFTSSRSIQISYEVFEVWLQLTSTQKERWKIFRAVPSYSRLRTKALKDYFKHSTTAKEWFRVIEALPPGRTLRLEALEILDDHYKSQENLQEKQS